MVEEIRWSDNAISDYNSIVEYLEKNWGEKIVSRFIDLTEYKIQQISSHPLIGIPSSKETNVRSLLITRHNRVYYRIISEKIIEIADIFDTRQNPTKNKFD